MEIKDKTIALLVDSDNISKIYFTTLLDELSQYGRVTYRRLYGDFLKPKANGWKDALIENSIELIYASSEYASQKITDPDTGKDKIAQKNTTDSKMIIDAMDILHENKVDCFCLATSDSDFTNLAIRFRNADIAVIGAGEEKTPKAFRNACDIFIPIDELLKADEKTLQQTPKSSIKQSQTTNTSLTDESSVLLDIINYSKRIIENGSDSAGLMHFAAFMNELRRKYNDFNPKLYGATANSPLKFFKNLQDSNGKHIFELKRIQEVDKIKMK